MMAKEVEDPIHSVYRMFVLLGLNPNRIVPNYTWEGDEDGWIALAFPDTKVGITFEGDRPEPFLESGWNLVPISTKTLPHFATVFQALTNLQYEDKRRSTMNAVKSVSSQEQVLIDACIKRGLPIPDRNYRLLKQSGEELTTPDLTWAEVKVAFFVDGLWWHVGREDTELLKTLSEATPEQQKIIVEQNKTRAERDGRIRTEMTSLGWKVLSCSDRDLGSHSGVETQVDIIERTIEQARKEAAMKARFLSESENQQYDIKDLI